MLGFRVPASKKLPRLLAGVFAAKLFLFSLFVGYDPFKNIMQPVTVPAMALMIHGFSFLFAGKGRVAYLFVADLALSLLLLFDVLFISTFKLPPSVFVLLLAPNGNALAPSIVTLLKPEHAIFFADLPFIAYFLLRKKRKWFFLRPSARVCALTCAGGCLLFSVKPYRDISIRGIFPTKAFDPGFLLGTPASEMCPQGLDIADLIIRKDYFALQ